MWQRYREKKKYIGCIHTVVGIFLVAGLGEDVALDALFAERVHAVETLGAAVVLEADLTHQELVVQFLRQTHPVPAARHRSEVLLILLLLFASAPAAVDGLGRRRGRSLLVRRVAAVRRRRCRR